MPYIPGMEPNSLFRSPDAKALFARHASAGDSYREAVSFNRCDQPHHIQTERSQQLWNHELHSGRRIAIDGYLTSNLAMAIGRGRKPGLAVW